MKIDLAGKINNTLLPKSRPLLPLFEAVVNSFQAIEEAKNGAHSFIEIFVERDDALVDGGGAVNGFGVTDNGAGFNDVNLDSFFTSDTQYKIGLGGKGLGRFLWLKAFQAVQIESHYRENGTILKRVFQFRSEEIPPDPAVPSDMIAPKTVVRLAGMKSPYKESCPRGLEVLGRQLVEHCLPFFLQPKCPTVELADDNQRINLNVYFADAVAAGKTHEFTVRNCTFTLKGLRFRDPQVLDHRLLYAANFREVFGEKLVKYLPNLQSKLIGSDGDRFVYLGFVEGDYLDKNVNSQRTGFVFADDRNTDSLFDEITLDLIREAALSSVKEDLAPYLEEINAVKISRINSYIAQEAPQYRPLIRYVPEFIDRIPPGLSGMGLDVALHEQMYEKQRALKQEGHRLIANGEKEALKPAEYKEKIQNFLERANELGKSSLAEYVAHRKVILDFLEKSLQANPETGKYPLEETIHKLIYPMRTTSDDVPYDQQNLWIIDERLAYHEFLASDMQLAKCSALENTSASRPDLMIFDRALTFAEDEGSLNSLVIIEFKKPDRRSYGNNEDPVDQVYRLIREIKSEHFKDKNGREIKIQSDRIPAYAYVICDTTKEIEVIAENKGMLRTPDNLGYYGYNQTLHAYVEVIPYTKLLKDAKKRNRILFDKLHLPSP